MAWYGWLSIGFLVCCVIVLIIVIFNRQPLVIRGLTDEERELLTMEKEKDKRLAEYDAFRTVKLEEITEEQKSKLTQLETAYNAAKSFIGAKNREEFEMYLNDARVAGDELDKLLGLRQGDKYRPVEDKKDQT